MENNNPVISVIIITYNSEWYVLEALESAKAQTYRNIELIITDDGSADRTLEICRNWLSINKNRFIRTELIVSEKNTGIPANCNRGLKAAKGAWIKFIAGDDILHEECIEKNIAYVLEKKLSDVMLVSDMLQFHSGRQTFREGSLVIPCRLFILRENMPPPIQHEFLKKSYFGNTPTLFISRKVFEKVCFDEDLHFVEDWPFAINATGNGFAFHYMAAVTAYYRISERSVYASKSPGVLFNDFYIKLRPVILKYIFPDISIPEKLFINMEYFRLRTIDFLGLNKNNRICRFIYHYTYRISPYRFYSDFKSKQELRKNGQ